jgi:hypothetical protein
MKDVIMALLTVINGLGDEEDEDGLAIIELKELARKEDGNIFGQIAKTDDAEIEAYKKWLSQYTTHECPEYIELMKIINGFEYPTLNLYSLNAQDELSIYKQNDYYWNDLEGLDRCGKDPQQILHDLRQYIIFADDAISLYCMNKNDGKYRELCIDYNGVKITDEYETFEELIRVGLEDTLYTSDGGYDEEICGLLNGILGRKEYDGNTRTRV